MAKPLNRIKEAMLDSAFIQKIAGISSKIDSHVDSFMPHQSGLNQYSILPDANSIYTKLEFKRPDNSLYMTSILSMPDENEKYTKATWTFYDIDGITAALIKVWTITYDVNGMPIAKEVI